MAQKFAQQWMKLVKKEEISSLVKTTVSLIFKKITSNVSSYLLANILKEYKGSRNFLYYSSNFSSFHQFCNSFYVSNFSFLMKLYIEEKIISCLLGLNLG